MNYKELRQKYPEFYYKSFDVSKINNDIKISFIFEVGEIEFTPYVLIKNAPKAEISNLQTFAFNLGLVEMISYWKATCSPKIVIEAGNLESWQVDWWKKLFDKGLRQFYFENRIDFTKGEIFTFEIGSSRTFKVIETESRLESALIGFSGGIDSTVTLDIFTKTNLKLGVFTLNPTVSSEKLVNTFDGIEKITVERGIDPDLLELNEKGYLNGHTPFSAYLAFISSLIAQVYGYKQIIFSNERSSDESNSVLSGQEINHQYSKTFEYEKDFREYASKYLSKNINYLSFLRPLYNLQITKLFAGNHKHFAEVKSCNVNQKSGTWCLTCAKCLSTFILLYPFVSYDEILKIFEGDIFENVSLFKLLDSLVDETKVKPFECVGTRDEIISALFLSVRIHGISSLPPLLEMANKTILSKYSDLESLSNKILSSWNNENNLPKDYQEILKKYV